MPLPFKLERALLDSNLQIVFEQPKDAPPKIRVFGDLGLRQFDLRDNAGESLAAWSALTINRLEIEPIARQVYVGDVGLWAPQVYARRYSNQRLNGSGMGQTSAHFSSCSPVKATRSVDDGTLSKGRATPVRSNGLPLMRRCRRGCTSMSVA